MRALPNALTVFLNALTARRMLSQHGKFSHVTANAHANAAANALASAPVSGFTSLTNAHRVEALVIPTQGEAILTLPPLY
jgi:hypothetical protein